jgi:hypothetical protein
VVYGSWRSFAVGSLLGSFAEFVVIIGQPDHNRLRLNMIHHGRKDTIKVEVDVGRSNFG